MQPAVMRIGNICDSVGWNTTRSGRNITEITRKTAANTVQMQGINRILCNAQLGPSKVESFTTSIPLTRIYRIAMLEAPTHTHHEESQVNVSTSGSSRLFGIAKLNSIMQAKTIRTGEKFNPCRCPLLVACTSPKAGLGSANSSGSMAKRMKCGLA